MPREVVSGKPPSDFKEPANVRPSGLWARLTVFGLVNGGGFSHGLATNRRKSKPLKFNEWRSYLNGR